MKNRKAYRITAGYWSQGSWEKIIRFREFYGSWTIDYVKDWKADVGPFSSFKEKRQFLIQNGLIPPEMTNFINQIIEI